MMLMPTHNFRSAGVTDSWLPEIFVFADAIALCIVVLYKLRKEKCAEKEEDAL